ncbi:MAG TPA: helix-turn-helix transcriptional regulator [Bacilli bacterium]|nr:helix-turn-helix transcriptional regulator [Bacilli bacterium]
MDFGERLANTRKKSNLTQEQLAALLNVTRQTISKWESNEFYPETDKLISLTKILDVSLDYLLLGKEEKISNNQSTIYIESEDSSIVSSVYKFVIRDIAFTKEDKGVPVCILCGVDKHQFLFGDHEIVLGYYATKEKAKEELKEILEAIKYGKNTYKLKYNSKVKGTKLVVVKD